MKKIIFFILCLISQCYLLLGQENTVLGTGALGQHGSPKYAIQSIQVSDPSGYSRPTVDLGNHTVYWEYRYMDVSSSGVYFEGYLRSESILQNIVPTIIGGHGNGATLVMYGGYFDGEFYHYEVYSDTQGSGYVPEVTLSSYTGSGFNIDVRIEQYGMLSVSYNDSQKTNLYTSQPTVNISFGGATAVAVLENSPANGQNTAVGHKALHNNLDGRGNTAIGHHALFNSNGIDNIGIGLSAGPNLTTGSNNLFIGTNAGKGVATGSGNVFIGNGSSFSLNSSMNNSIVFTDGFGNPKVYVGHNGNTKLGYGYDFTESDFKLDVNGHMKSLQSKTNRLTTKDVSFVSPQSSFYHDFLFSSFDANTLQLRAVVDQNNYPTVFSVDKPTARLTFYAPVKGSPAVNNNEFVTLGQLASGQTIGANISGASNLSNVLLNANISGQDLTNSSIVSASSFRAMNGYNLIGAPDNGWWNILSIRHSNAANDYRMEIAGSYSDPQKIVFRNTADSPTRGWSTFFHSGNTDYVRSSLGLPSSGNYDLQGITDRGNMGSNSLFITGENRPFGNPTTQALLLEMRNNGAGGKSGLVGAYDYTSARYIDLSLNSNPNFGNVGIGTTVPQFKLDVANHIRIGAQGGNDYTLLGGGAGIGSHLRMFRTDGTENIRLTGNNDSWLNVGYGNVGIGTATIDNVQGWQKVLQVHGNEHAKLLVTEGGGVKVGMYAHTGNNAKIGTESQHDLTFTAGYWNDVMTLRTTGNVGIGTTSPTEKLSVNGKIRAREVKVEPVNGWPDYVFEETYKPKTLKEIEAFIKVNKHLPEVPSAKEVEKNGVELGEMNRILLRKIEELTLLLIEQNKRIEDLEKKNNQR